MTQALTGFLIALFLMGAVVEVEPNPECQFLQAKAQSIREAQGATRDSKLGQTLSSVRIMTQERYSNEEVK